MDSRNAQESRIIELTAEVVAAYAANNQLDRAELPALIASVAEGLKTAGAPIEPAAGEKPLVPAVSVKKSVTDDFIICLEDGKAFKSLKRHLMTHHELTPEAYRAKWKLLADYPMVAPGYAAKRSQLAHSIGLGRKPKAVAPPAAQSVPEPEKPAPKRRAVRKTEQAPDDRP